MTSQRLFSFKLTSVCFQSVYHVIPYFWYIWNYGQFLRPCPYEVSIMQNVCTVSFVNMRHGNRWGWPSPSSRGSLGIPGRSLGPSQPSGMQSSEEVTTHYLTAIYQFSDLGQDFILSSSVFLICRMEIIISIHLRDSYIKKKWGNGRKCLSHSKLLLFWSISHYSKYPY